MHDLEIQGMTLRYMVKVMTHNAYFESDNDFSWPSKHFQNVTLTFDLEYDFIYQRSTPNNIPDH